LTLSSGANITGNVGIGTSSPGAKFAVNGGTGTSQTRFEVSTTQVQEVSTNAAVNAYADRLYDAAQHVWKLSSSQAMVLNSSGNVGIGTGSPGTKLDVVSATNAGIRVSDGTYTGIMYPSGLGGIAVGTTSNHPYIILANNTERMRVTATGDVGIGTGSPGAKLDISNGQFRLSAAYQVQWFNGATQLGSILCDSGPNLTFQTGSSNTERMRIDSSGNVGIGTASPAVKLHVYSSAAALRVESSSTGQPIYQTFYNGAANQTYFGIESSSGTGIIGTGAAYATLLSTVSTTPLVFGTNSAERMRITSTGNVGIGTASPATRLDVVGGRTTLAANSETYALGVRYLSSTGPYYIGATNSASPDLVFSQVGGSERMRLGDGGGLSVGTTAVGTAGEIRATNNITAYYSDARLKDFKGKIGDALYKVSQLNGYYYTENEKAEEFGYNNKELQVGVSAQEVQAVLPEVIAPAPFDMNENNESKSGDNYMTVRYEKLVPLLIEAIKELKAEVEALKAGK
jgi:hypothetical protein